MERQFNAKHGAKPKIFKRGDTVYVSDYKDGKHKGQTVPFWIVLERYSIKFAVEHKLGYDMRINYEGATVVATTKPKKTWTHFSKHSTWSDLSSRAKHLPLRRLKLLKEFQLFNKACSYDDRLEHEDLRGRSTLIQLRRDIIFVLKIVVTIRSSYYPIVKLIYHLQKGEVLHISL
ncbi:unnamed protein product [Heligmosomoides polygyrus]|uniref:Reverse transcriptase domain-containing protein n=1 Tax=Heligmosomoides polygyrus TaxID=6339 RepID=A0A183GQZ7_HELPZ|nr:unnamed protein product [Heligmosomoides polygyrus]